MATMEQCAAALHTLAERMAAASQSGDTSGFSRVVSCQIPDLSGGFTARLEDGTLHDIAEGEDPDAQITLTASSDDLVALATGRRSDAPRASSTWPSRESITSAARASSGGGAAAATPAGTTTTDVRTSARAPALRPTQARAPAARSGLTRAA